MNNYDWLVARLDAFIRKYYANKLIRGVLVFLSCVLFYVLMVTLGEYYLYLPVWVRVGLLSVFVALGLSALVVWVAIPLAKMARLGSVISHEQAAEIIGRHFPEVSDKLLNILQLHSRPADRESRELAEASISQKIGQISVVPISSAIDLSGNRRYLRFLLPPLMAGIFILIAAPNVFKESSERLLRPTTEFERPAPFRFVVKNKDLTAVRNSDLSITMQVEGDALPADASVEIGDELVAMRPTEGHTFEYTFRNVTEAMEFRFHAAGFRSRPYAIRVIQRPVLRSFSIAIHYPAYLDKKDEVRNSLGDMVLPVGSTVSWTLLTNHTDAAAIRFEGSNAVTLGSGTDKYSYSSRFMGDSAYTLTLFNNKAAVADSFTYHVQVIPDQYPVIELQQFRDSLSGKQILLSGSAGDDHGISRVLFHYNITAGAKTVESKSIPLKIGSGALASFEQYFDIHSLNLAAGQKVSYYIEAWDNDGVHGSKASRSDVMSYQMYDAEQMDSAIKENSEQINAGISSSAERTKQLQSDYKDAQNKMMQSSNMDWQTEQMLQQMMEKQKDLKTQVEKVKERFEEQIQQSEQKNYSEDLKEKQQELNKQLNNMLNEELKKQMEKLQELMQKLNKEQAMEAMKQLEQENKLFSMDMERMQELMKRMELQMRMEDLANKAEEIAQKQRDLKDQTVQNKKDAATLAKEQKKLQEQLEKALKEDLKEAQQLAKETKEKDRMENEEQKGKDAAKDMEQGAQDLDQKQNDKAGKEQDDAAKNLEEMAKSLREKAAGMDMEQIELDIKATRQILSNLIRLSFAQEDLMDKVKVTSPASQAYLENMTEQNKLHRNSKMIRDSLFELSKRIVKLAPNINKSTTDLERRMQMAVKNLEDRRIPTATTDQQYVMTYTNNLALLLNELLANLMQQQSQGKQGGSAGMCRKPGGKKGQSGSGPQLSDIITQQQQLGDGMSKMQKPGNKPGDGKEGQKDGDKPGQQPGQKPGQGNKPGQGPNGQGSAGSGNGQEGDNGEYGNAEQLAKLAQQQAAIRRQLAEMASKLNSKGMGALSKELRELEQKMDKNETDLVNRRVNSPDLMIRQKEIETRLLEAEKAIREQEQDEKRSSKSAGDPSRPIPAELQKYITDKKQMLEQYKTVPPQLRPYYRQMVEQYFQIIGNK
ncbi:hypothetical protein GCM10023093_28050 [Nemorincola caseinilytica]|uniref:DUF4175 domain-containing protein n=1 Tax=Nemorincola caseinilytica TaxID=2054315 RepID=A0ABP8NL65_9BACT